MKRIERMKDLEDYGIDALTGESDAHMYRILCDVTKKGKAIIERVMDIGLNLHPNWNSGKKHDPHIGSLLLPQEFVPSIAAFALLTDTEVSEVWLLKNGTALGFGVEDVETKEALRKMYDGEIRHIFRPRPSDRNLHQMSGRTA